MRPPANEGFVDHVHIDVMHNFAFLPPKLRRGNGIASTAEALSAYLGAHLEHQGLDLVEAVKQWPWKFDPTVNNLERMLQALSDVMYDSLERSIKLATWSAEFVKPVQGAMQEIPKTRAFYDRVESNVLVRLIENVAYLHEKLIDGFFKIMAEARGSGSAGSDDPHEKAIKDIYQLLEEVDSRYRNALLVVYYEAELWFLATREVRSSIAVRNSLMTLEKWFDIRIRATEMAIQFVNEPSSDFGSSIDRYLRLELSVSLDKPLEELVERRIVALINEKNMVFPRQKYGYEYRMPDWKETSVEREDRNSRLNKTRRESWDKYIHNIRNNATNWVEGRTRSPLRKTPSPERISPGLKVGGSISYAYTDEAEFRKMKGRPPAVPRRRSQIPKNEYRVFKMFKYHDAQYARGYWYTNVGLLENFRQMFQRGSLTFEETKELFNKKSNGTGSILLGDRIKTSEHAIKAIETALMDYHPTTEFEDMVSCTSGSDHDIPVRERLETWDVTSSEGTQDGEGRWVSKRNLDSEGKRRRRRLRAD